MTSQKTYTEACDNFDQIYDEAISNRKPIVVTREGIDFLQARYHYSDR